MIAIGSLLLVLAISLVVTRVATVILTATGVSRHDAAFQARSAFTGAGFTTTESERVVDHPLRRRVIATLMLLGNVGIVAAASTAILGFRSGGLGGRGWRLLALGVGMLAIVFISRNAWVDRHLTVLIKRVLRRYTDVETRDLAGLLDLAGKYAVSELSISEGDWVADRTLTALALRDEGVVVLGVTRADGRYVGAPIGDTVISVGDILIVYGRSDQLSELDERPVGHDGDLAHTAGVARQNRLEFEQSRSGGATSLTDT